MVDFVGAPSGAQEADPIVASIPAVGTSAEQAVSDDGNIVVFEAAEVNPGTDETTTQVLIHDRRAASTVAVPTSGAHNPSISANGCFVTYSTFTAAEVETVSTSSTTSSTSSSVPEEDVTTSSVEDTVPDDTASDEAVVQDQTNDDPQPGLGNASVEAASVVSAAQAAPSSSELFAFDRCADPVGAPVLVAAVQGTPEALPAAAVSADGVVIAYSDFDGIVRMQGTLTGYTASAPFDTDIAATPEQVTGSKLDISADGSTIVFEAGTDKTPDDATDAVELGVYRWTDGVAPEGPVISPVASLSTAPSLSVDGALVAFESTQAPTRRLPAWSCRPHRPTGWPSTSRSTPPVRSPRSPATAAMSSTTRPPVARPRAWR